MYGCVDESGILDGLPPLVCTVKVGDCEWNTHFSTKLFRPDGRSHDLHRAGMLFLAYIERHGRHRLTLTLYLFCQFPLSSSQANGLAYGSLTFTLFPSQELAKCDMERTHFTCGHFNPAVTLFAYLMKEINGSLACMYLVGQSFGACMASLVLVNVIADAKNSELGLPGKARTSFL